MNRKFSESFRSNVVEKTINRGSDVTLEDIANAYGIDLSTVGRWRRESQQQRGKQAVPSSKEKRPQDWTIVEKLQAVIDCEPLDEEASSAYCRGKGLYTHHIKQWKQDFMHANGGAKQQADKQLLKTLKEENKQLKQELRRKEKALAETAALLVLKKKAQQIWGSDGDN